MTYICRQDLDLYIYVIGSFAGLNVPKPEFMNGPFRKRKPKYIDSSDSDEEWRPGAADKAQRKTGGSI